MPIVPENSILAICNDKVNYEKVRQMALTYNIDIRHVETIEEALEQLADNNNYQLIIIRGDRVRYMHGLKLLCDMIIAPILVISAIECPNEKIEALRMGANVFITGAHELEYVFESCLALIRLYRNLNNENDYKLTTLTHHYILLCVEFRTVYIKGKEIYLSRTEFDILRYLMKKPGRVFTYGQIYNRVWKEEYTERFYDNLYNHISRLRQKLKISSDIPNYIITVKGIGYKLDIK